MSSRWKIAIGILAVAVLIGLLSFGDLRQRVRLLSQAQNVEEQSRREVLTPPLTTPTDVAATARIFWAAGWDRVAPVEVPLALSADPAQRSKQVLHALIASPPSPEQRTVPADVELLGFYVLPDGSAVADFSDALVSETPSGVVSEQLVLDSITRTLASNVTALKRLKILIHGQEVETLAGHVDLTGFLDLNPAASPETSSAAGFEPSRAASASPLAAVGGAHSSASPAPPPQPFGPKAAQP